MEREPSVRRAVDAHERHDAEAVSLPSRPRVTRTVVASDVRLVREALATSLARREGLELSVLPADATDLLERLPALSADVILLDMNARGAFELAGRILATAPNAKLVAFAVTEVERDIVACLEAGISGFVARDGSVDDVVAAIHSARNGELYCSPRVAQTMQRRLASLASARAD